MPATSRPKEILTPYGQRVFVIEFLSKWNHLDNNFGPVADKLALVNEDALPGYFLGMLDGLGWELIQLPGENGRTCEINLLAMGDDRVLSFRGNRLNDRLRAMGLQVYDPEYSVFVEHGGGIHCSTFELEREPWHGRALGPVPGDRALREKEALQIGERP